MGVLPLQFKAGENVASLGLTGQEIYDFTGLAEAMKSFGQGKTITVKAGGKSFQAIVRIDTPQEMLY
jgi:aconitate hydratase